MARKNLKIIVFFVLLLPVILYAYTAIYVSKRVYLDNKTKSDAIIVLGARSFVDGKVNECLASRVEHAVDLYNDGFAQKIIMSGGTDKKPVFQNTNEAEEMKKMALGYDEDLKPEDILTEGESTSTYENLLDSSKIMQENGLKTAIIVTEPFHSPRANLVADKLNIDHTISPTMTSPCWIKSHFLSIDFLREPIALIGYKLFNQI